MIGSQRTVQAMDVSFLNQASFSTVQSQGALTMRIVFSMAPVLAISATVWSTSAPCLPGFGLARRSSTIRFSANRLIAWQLSISWLQFQTAEPLSTSRSV